MPSHLVVIGAGYVGLELAQAYRRFGSRVTLIEAGPQIAGREDADVATAILDVLRDEGIIIHLDTKLRRVEGRSGHSVVLRVETPRGEDTIECGDLLVAVGRTPNTPGHRATPGGCDAGRARLHRGQRATGDERAQYLGGWGMPRKPASHPCIVRRLRRRPRQFCRRQPHDNRPPGPLLHVYRSATGAGQPERNDAKRLGIPIRVAKLPMPAVLRTRTISETRGFMKH